MMAMKQPQNRIWSCRFFMVKGMAYYSRPAGNCQRQITILEKWRDLKNASRQRIPLIFQKMAKYPRRRRSQAGEDFFQRGIVSGQVRCGIIQRHRAFRKESFRLPVIQAKHRTYLPLREASGAIAFNRRVFHDVTAYHVGGFSPLTGNLIGHFHCDLHNAANLARPRRHWQSAFWWQHCFCRACSPLASFATLRVMQPKRKGKSAASQLSLGIQEIELSAAFVCKGVFSANYLQQHFGKSEGFPTIDELRPIYEKIKNRWLDEFVGLCQRKEAYTRTEFLDPVLKEIGWTFIPEQELPSKGVTRKRPDYSSSARCIAGIC
jgi:hypothetical protein